MTGALGKGGDTDLGNLRRRRRGWELRGVGKRKEMPLISFRKREVIMAEVSLGDT